MKGNDSPWLARFSYNNAMRTRLIALLVVTACNKTNDVPSVADAAPATSTVASASAPSASAPSATPRPAAESVQSVFAVYVGNVGKDHVALGVERRGDEVHAAFVQGYAVPIDLDGKAKSDGSIAIVERGFLTRKGSKLDFKVDAKGALTGTLTDPKSKAPVKLALALGTPFTDKDETFEKSYEGSLGSSTRLRAKWKRDKHLLTGVYRYARSKEDLKLDGTVIASTGAFDVTEKNAKGTVTGKWQGVFVSPAIVVGRWSSPDGSKSYPIALTAGQPYPEIVAIAGGGKITPQEDYSERGKACRSSIVYPDFEGLPVKAVETALDSKLRTFAGVGAPLKAEDCEGAEEALPYDMETDYSISAQRTGFVGLEMTHYAFTGGAHGNWGAQCYVADLTSGRLVQLAKELSPEALGKLSKLTKAQLQKDNGDATSLTEAGFFTDDPQVTADTNLCVRDDKGTLSLEVSFQPYEVGPWAMGAPTVQIPSSVAATLFSPGTMGAVIFK